MRGVSLSSEPDAEEALVQAFELAVTLVRVDTPLHESPVVGIDL